ncbi:MFS transporter [Alteraurantiacibacter aquimixticola]|uniref:MFS transporter n=1 Tax=Alteraurantiacibacter aquimixticola TaxID=2489173 RepID=A0A4T3F673_9SPHN|nr:MFS transporter [Alteraurantiacibacter aquimixticola]TIX52009.1 MFS transporter [Alteraurantiacibacter aquimixticola]
MDQAANIPTRTDAAASQHVDTHPGLPTPRRWWAIIAISFGTSLLVIDGSIPNVALPTIARELGVSNSVVTNVVTVYQLVLVMLLLPFSSLGDRIGHRRLYQYGQGVFMLASALCLFADSLTLLLLLRALQAIGAGMALSVSAAMLRQIYPAKSLGAGLGVNSVIVASSAALAPTLGGYIVGHLDWQWVFVAAAPLAIVSLLLGQALPEPEPQDRKNDWLGSVWSALTMLLVIGGLQLGTHGYPPVGVLLALAGVVSLVGLVRREKASPAPVLPVDLLSKPVIGLSALAGMSSFIAAGSLMLSLPFRLEEGMGYDPQTVGLLLLPFPLTMLVVSPLAGWMSDRVAATKLGVTGMSIAIIGLLLLAFMPDDPGETGIALRLAFTALGFGLFFAPNTRLLIGRAPRDRAAAAGGLMSTSRLLGQTLAAVAVGILLAGGLGMGPVPMFVSCALAAVAALCSLTRYQFRASKAG